MSFILKNVRSEALQRWLKANATASVRGNAQDSWRAYLLANGGVGSTLRDLENSFLRAAGATLGNLGDQWRKNLSASSGTKGGEKARSKYQ